MVSIKGRSVFGSIARGKLTFYHRDEFIINKIKVSDPELEYKKYVKAKNAALVELGELYDRARLSVGEGDAQIFVIHQMLITDEQYDSSIRTKILDEHFNADYAVASTSRSFAEMLAQMDSEYMQSRAADVKDVSNRLLRHILNCADKLTILKENAIICTAGSFDPVTLGHLDIIDRASKLFDKVIVLVSFNANKSRAAFTPTERMEMIIEATKHLDNVVVDCYNGLLADYLQKTGANAIVKGLRAVSDFEYEFQMALANKKLYNDAETVFLTTTGENMFLSSSVVKEIASFGGDITGFVPKQIQSKITDRLYKPANNIDQ